MNIIRKGILAVAMMSMSAFAALLNDAASVRTSSDGGVTVAQDDAIVILSDDFAQPSDKWVLPHAVFQDFTWIHHAPAAGVPSLRIERNPKRIPPEKRLFDTAWQLKTVPITLPANTTRITMELNVISNKPEMVYAAGHGNGYKNAIGWLTDNGKTLIREDGFFFNVAETFSAKTFLEFEIPKGADTIVLYLGADTPDLLPSEFVAFTGVRIAAFQQNSRYSHSASFTTNAIRIDGPVTWKADVPANTSLSLQAAVAPEVNSVPGTWTEFKAIQQGQSPESFAPNAKWIKFKVNMTATDTAAPVLHSIQAGAKLLANWRKDSDTTPPRPMRTSASPTEDAMKPYVFTAVDDNPIQWNSFTVKVDDAEMPMTRQNDTVTIPAPKEGWKPGVHIVSIVISDILGNRITEEQAFFIGKIRSNNLVTMRDDGMTLIDGKPFFPIGMACAVKCDHNDNSFDKLFSMFEEAGMNFARHFSGFTLRSDIAMEYINAAEKHGIKLYIAGGLGANDCNIKTLAENIAFQRHLPNVAWDTGDDTADRVKPDQMRQRYNAIKAVDPYRITTQADSIGSFACTRYRPYALYSDNFSPEIYPLHDPQPNADDIAVPIFISSMKKIKEAWRVTGCSVRNCWPLIGYFYNCGDTDRLPTTEQLRAMTYQCIIHGAHGVIWYRYAGYRENGPRGFLPNEWEVVANLSKELRGIYDVLCARAAKEQPTVTVLSGEKQDQLGNDSVSALLKDCGGKRWLFTGSSVRTSVQASFTLPAGAKKVTDYFENRPVKIANGTITETFAPLGVHVYIIE